MVVDLMAVAVQGGKGMLFRVELLFLFMAR